MKTLRKEQDSKGQKKVHRIRSVSEEMFARQCCALRGNVEMEWGSVVED